MGNYQTNLNSTLNGLDAARTQVETGRRFMDAYEDPAAAGQAVVLDNRYARSNEYLSATKDAISWQATQEDVLIEINDILKEVDKKYSMEALNGTNQENREIYAATFREMQKSMVYTLNTMYGNAYVTGGNDAYGDPPFALDEDTGVVTYRGIDVNSADADDQAKLAEYAAETAYVDLGFGLTFDGAGEIIPSSAFDSAMPGVDVMGYGVDAAGNPKNAIVIMGEMADLLETEPFDSDQYNALWESLGNNADDVRNSLAEIGTKSQLLDATELRLENEIINIQEQYTDEVGIKATDAITNYSYSQYVYNASLRVGMSILSQSLLDFLR